jgi:carboxymethylenebutenolidase
VPTTRTESITAPDGQSFDGHLTVPDTGSGPGILLLQEIFGVGDFLLSKAADLANLGYVVLCPDVFWRVQRNVALAHDEAALQEASGS